jgi:hypothetical protein
MRAVPPVCRSAAVALLVALACVPPERLAELPPLCLFKAAFEVECFGCGITRALSAALHGDLGAAVAYNRLVLIALPGLFLAAVMPDTLRRMARKRRVA